MSITKTKCELLLDNYSCALTLAQKFKFKSLSKLFKKFGRDLGCFNGKRKKFNILGPTVLKALPKNEKFRIIENTNIEQLLR